MRRLLPALLVSLLLALQPSPAAAQAGRGEPVAAAVAGVASGRAVRTDRPPLLDGRDDDAAWRGASPIDDFRQFTPAEDGEPSFRTEVRATYDSRHLYVLVRAFDPRPDSIVALLSRRDVATASDRVSILIDGYSDRRTGIAISVNPAGVKTDVSIYGDFVEDPTWDGIWDVATRVDSAGWVAEFRLPFGQIRFARGVTSFGFAVSRHIARRNESVGWPLFRMSRAALASQFGRLEGFAGVERGSRLELLPYVVTRNVTERDGDAWRHPQQLTAGADLKLGLTPNFTIDATVNPDFGQVEVDPAILNLSAFEVRFEERRPFFQEGVGLFKCGGPCEGIFYTRRIGRTPQLRASAADPSGTTILGAAKLTGRFGNGVAVGLVEAVTGREEGAGGSTIEPRTNYVVGRLVKEMREGRSSLGVMATGVNRDLDAATSRFLRREAYTTLLQGFHRFARDQWEVMAYTGQNTVRGSEEAIARTQLNPVHLYQRPGHEEGFDPARTSLRGHVVGASLSKIGGMVRWNSFARRASPGLELNDLGFVPVVNDMSLRNQLTVSALRPGSFYRRLTGSLENAQNWTTGGLKAGMMLRASAGIELPNSWGVSLSHGVFDLASSYCVACARGGPAVRQSPKQESSLKVSGDPRRAWVPRLEVGAGRGEEGHTSARWIVAGTDVRMASRFSMSVAPEYVRRTDDQQWIGNFGAPLSDTTHHTFARLHQTTVAMTTRANWTASPTLSLQLYAQPFVSTGRFTNWREIDQPGAARYVDRYRAYGGGATPPGFNFKQFNSNAVARWEYRPGSILFVVWQQGRLQDDRNAGSFELARDSRDLFRAHPENTLLVKLSYWLNP